ncbi:MAG TPA: hypothetical protein VM531_12385 [Sphingomicrobium sp.]|jgi:hypothetical protein|nr:hypothetical protein [Sphingomicrobium sp.]
MALNDPIAVAGNFVSVVGLPAYIGLTDRNLGIFALYVLLAGLLLTFLHRFTVRDCSQKSGETLLQAAIPRVGSFALASGTIYFLAVLAI